MPRSQQAKGRIEGTWRTFQDRLISQLRLDGAATLDQANVTLSQFFADYNTSFAKDAVQAGTDYRKLDSRSGPSSTRIGRRARICW